MFMYYRSFCAEWLGTFIMILFGNGVCAQSVLSNSVDASFLSINFGWAIGVIIGIYCTGGVSGGHLNPGTSQIFPR